MLKSGEILVFRTINKDGLSFGGHQWLLNNHVGSCPDWKNTSECGHGFHGLPWAVGSSNLVDVSFDRFFQVLKVDTRKGNYQEFDGKCKFNEYEQVFCKQNALVEVIQLIQQFAPANIPINWANQTAGNGANQTAGYKSTQTAGNGANQTAGIGTVQIIRYYKNGCKVKTRIITEKEANKPYKFENEDWVEIK